MQSTGLLLQLASPANAQTASDRDPIFPDIATIPHSRRNRRPCRNRQDRRPRQLRVSTLTLLAAPVGNAAIRHNPAVLGVAGGEVCPKRLVASSVTLLPPLRNHAIANKPTLPIRVLHRKLHLTARVVRRPASQRVGLLYTLLVHPAGPNGVTFRVPRTIRGRHLVAVDGLAAAASKPEQRGNSEVAKTHHDAWCQAR